MLVLPAADTRLRTTIAMTRPPSLLLYCWLYQIWYCVPYGFSVIIFALLASNIFHTYNSATAGAPKWIVAQFVTIWSLTSGVSGKLGGMASFFNALDNVASGTARLLSILEAVRSNDHIPRPAMLAAGTGTDTGTRSGVGDAKVVLASEITLDKVQLSYVTRGSTDEVVPGSRSAVRVESGEALAVSEVCIPKMIVPVGTKGSVVRVAGGTHHTRRTIMDVLMLRRDAAGGRVTFDGLAALPVPSSLSGVVGAALSKDFMQLLPGATVFANVAFGRNVKVQTVTRACHLANCQTWIDTLPRTYHTELTSSSGEPRVPLTRVQVFQVSLARALCCEPLPKVVLAELWSLTSVRRQSAYHDSLRSQLQGPSADPVAAAVARARDHAAFVADVEAKASGGGEGAPRTGTGAGAVSGSGSSGPAAGAHAASLTVAQEQQQLVETLYWTLPVAGVSVVMLADDPPDVPPRPSSVSDDVTVALSTYIADKSEVGVDFMHRGTRVGVLSRSLRWTLNIEAGVDGFFFDMTDAARRGSDVHSGGGTSTQSSGGRGDAGVVEDLPGSKDLLS